jgi:hypothetical protein
MSKSLAEYKQPPDATGIHCLKIGHPKNLRINLTLLSSALLDGNCETGMAITISCAVVDSISGATNAENNINEWFNHSTYQLLSSTLKPSETKSIYIYYIYMMMITRNSPAMKCCPLPMGCQVIILFKAFPLKFSPYGPQNEQITKPWFPGFSGVFQGWRK